MFLEQHADDPGVANLRLVREQTLTRRELEIARMASDGLSGREIAQRLSRSPRTVENHIRSIYRKLGVRNRVEMVRVVAERGFLPSTASATSESARLKLQGRTLEHVMNINNVLAATDHDDYFLDLVVAISRELGVRWVGISETEPREDAVYVIAMAESGDVAGQVEAKFRCSPCFDAVNDGLCTVKHDVRSRYPDDDVLQGMPAECYVGVRLEDRLLGTLGALWLMDDKPIDDAADAEQLLAIMAPRTAAELALAQTLDAQGDER